MAEGGLTFLLDENAPHRLARSLRELGEPAFHVYDFPGLKGAPDEIVLGYAGERGWCFVGSDRRILRRPHERAVLARMGMGAFFFAESIVGVCALSRTLYRHWPEMKRLAGRDSRPFLYLLGERSIRSIRRRKLG